MRQALWFAGGRPTRLAFKSRLSLSFLNRQIGLQPYKRILETLHNKPFRDGTPYDSYFESLRDACSPHTGLIAHIDSQLL